MEVWSDTNRYNQTGYSAPTVFPKPEDYQDKHLWLEDYTKAMTRQGNREEWLWEQRAEARMEELERIAEAKAEREEWM